MGNKFTSMTFRVCPLRHLSLDLTKCCRKWDMFIKGKTALVTGAASGIGLECVKALLNNEAQVSYIGWLHWNVREVVKTRLHSRENLRGSGYFVDKKSCYLLRMYVYETPEFVTEVVHGSTLHCRTIIANCCNISHARFFHVILCLVMNTI